MQEASVTEEHPRPDEEEFDEASLTEDDDALDLDDPDLDDLDDDDDDLADFDDSDDDPEPELGRFQDD
jgi:DNA-directed RNA polymerase subunit delta